MSAPNAISKIEDVIWTELSKGMETITQEKPTCIVHVFWLRLKCLMAVSARLLHDFKRHKTYGSVNHCGSLIRRFHSMSVANVTEHLSQNDFISVTDI